jgi:hypothetical protein
MERSHNYFNLHLFILNLTCRKNRSTCRTEEQPSWLGIPQGSGRRPLTYRAPFLQVSPPALNRDNALWHLGVKYEHTMGKIEAAGNTSFKNRWSCSTRFVMKEYIYINCVNAVTRISFFSYKKLGIKMKMK